MSPGNAKRSDRCVIGGGITALIAGYLLDADVIGYRPGVPPWAPIWLWYDKFSEKFVKEVFGSKLTPPIGYAGIQFVYKGQKIPNEVGRDLYSRKVYGRVDPSAACKGKDEFCYIKIPVPVIAEQIKTKVNVIDDWVKAIKPDRNVIITENHGKLEYSEIYSTIMLNKLIVMCGHTIEEAGIDEPKGWPMYFRLDYGDTFRFAHDTKITYICDPSDDTRIFYMGHYYLIETKRVTKLGPMVKVLNRINLREFDGIKLIGRHGRWNPNIMLHHVIRELYLHEK